MGPITSSKNELIKEIKLLKEKKHREDKQLFVIEGIRFVEEAINQNASISNIIISEEFNNQELLEKIKSNNFRKNFVSNKVFKEITDVKTPQGILATVKFQKSSLHFNKDLNLFLILDGIQDPGNMGTIIRTADSSGFSQIILSKGCVDIYNPKVLRSTMGSIFNVSIHNSSDLKETIRDLKSNNIRIYSTALSASHIYFNADLKNNIAIVLGNEANGVSREVLDLSDELIHIPIAGKAESLNVSIASAVVMYESLRQRYLPKT